MSIQDTILIRWMMKTLNLNHKFKFILFYVFLFFNYAVIKMTIDGIYVNSQSLNFWSDTLTHEIKIKNLQDRHLSVKVIRH